MVDTPVHVPFPEAEGDLELRVALGACRIEVRPGGDEPWVEGTYDDPTGDLPIRIRTDGPVVTIDQEKRIGGVLGLVRGAPRCALALGTARPYALTFDTGASDVSLALGGLPLGGLLVRAGAGKVEMDVDRPNPVAGMSAEIRVGAGSIDAEGLGNLNARILRVDGGASSIEIDLRGEQRVALDARVSGRAASVEVTVPEHRAVRIHTEATLGEVDLGDGLMTKEGAIWTTSADPDQPVTIDLRASVALGALALRAR